MLPTANQWKKWSLPSRYSAIGLLVAVLSILLFNILPLLKEGERGKEFKRLLFQATNELRYNREYLHGLAHALRSKQSPIPIGNIKYEALLDLLGKNYKRLAPDAYGEEKYIYQLAMKLRDASSALGGPRSQRDLLQFNGRYEMTIDDLLFLSGFLNWYLGPLAKSELSKYELDSLGWDGIPGRTFAPSGINTLHMRFFVDEGKPITDFALYLGLID